VSGAIRFVGRSVMLPDGEEPTFDAYRESEHREFEFERFQERNEVTDSDRRAALTLSTAQSDVVVRDLVNLASIQHTWAALIGDVTVEHLGDSADEIVVAALLQSAMLKETRVWPDDLDRRAREILSRKDSAVWVVIWIAAQIGFIPVSEAARRVPWHALLLGQELVLTDEIDILGPRPLRHDLVACLNDQGRHRLLEAVGERISLGLADGGTIPRVDASDVAHSFVFASPPGDWAQAEGSEGWSDAFLVCFALLGRVAAVAWGSGHALGETIDESDRAILRKIAAETAGWGNVDEDALGEIAEPYRKALICVLRAPLFGA